MKIAICDDSKEYIKTIEAYIDKLKPSKIEYDVFMSGEELLNEYEKSMQIMRYTLKDSKRS